MRLLTMTHFSNLGRTPVAIAGFDEPMIEVTDLTREAIGVSPLIDRTFVTRSIFERCVEDPSRSGPHDARRLWSRIMTAGLMSPRSLLLVRVAWPFSIGDFGGPNSPLHMV
jgi:hypothetical protein